MNLYKWIMLNNVKESGFAGMLAFFFSLFQFLNAGVLLPESVPTELMVFLGFVLILIMWGIGFLCMLIDRIVEKVSKFVTDGDHTICRLIENRLNFVEVNCYSKRYREPYICLAAFNGILMFGGSMLYVMPPLISISILLVVGVIIAVLYLSRFAYRLHKRFGEHVNDPNAHNKGEA